jgi:hypothetical protein
MAEPLQNLSLDQLKTLLKRSFLQQPLGRIGEEAYREVVEKFLLIKRLEEDLVLWIISGNYYPKI